MTFRGANSESDDFLVVRIKEVMTFVVRIKKTMTFRGAN